MKFQKRVATALSSVVFLNVMLLLVAACSPPSCASTDTFGTEANRFGIEFVTIDDPGNSPDTTGDPNPAGSVDYVYRIGKHEISRDMIQKANDVGGLGITMLDLTRFGGNDPDRPATEINWLEAIAFVNWLNSSSGYPVAYKFVDGDFQSWQPDDPGYDLNNVYRNRRAHYFLPSADEWYKAAYFDGQSNVYYDFPTGSDTPPTPVSSGTAAATAVYNQAWPAVITEAGGLSPYGTMGQGGNANEWLESDFLPDSIASRRVVRGGAWGMNSVNMSVAIQVPVVPSAEVGGVGFRVASIPEPSSQLLGVVAILAMFALRRKTSR